ncbi:MAG: hypothetical protein AB7F43_13715 [Bacteriovoracia bacterium]
MYTRKIRLIPALLVALMFQLWGSQAFAARAYAGPFTTIGFAYGQSDLSYEAKAKLDELMKRARAMANRIDEVRVAAWSDYPLPREGEQLTKVDRELAKKRLRSISTYLKKNLEASYVQSFNMAQRSNWLSRFFETPDAQLKTHFYENSNELMTKEEFRIFRDNGDVSTAVILVMMKRDL